MAELFAAYPKYEYTQFDTQMVAMFVFIFGAFTAAQSIAMGPDIKKATKAAMKIFQIMRTPSKVDTGTADVYKTKTFVKYEVETNKKNKNAGLAKRDSSGNKKLYEGDGTEEYLDGVIYEEHPT